jgi:2,4-dienoyl-CoA reductase (NADPH2)
VLVVGGGPGGLRAAATAAGRGHRVTLFERAETTGGAVVVAAAAAGRAELGEVVRALRDECARAGVEVRTGVEVDASVVDAERPDLVVLATGARPGVPVWANGHPRVVDVSAVLTGAVAPEGSVLVVDELGYHPATSTAETLAARGARVEIVTSALVVGQDLGVTLDMELFVRRAHAAGIVLTTDRVVMAVADAGSGGGVGVTLLRHTVGEVEEREVDWVVTAAPGAPEDGLWRALRDRPFPVHRIGDCLAPRRADAAIREGDRIGAAL